VFAEKVRTLTPQQQRLIEEEKKLFGNWDYETRDVSAAIVLQEALIKLRAGEIHLLGCIEPGDSPIFIRFEETESYKETKMDRPN
jgi:hypothetical protein